ncbi:MAG: aminoacyl-tRNA hydrolase [Verrucomicrobiota bacterium]
MPAHARLIFGLGNPGAQYHSTRHNIGFLVLDHMAHHDGQHWKKTTFANASEVKLANGARLIKPESYMNRSGQVVQATLKWYKIDPEDVLIIVDDIHLNLGQLRLRRSGSPGGHNGLKSIENGLQTDQYPRLRAGVGSPFSSSSLSHFVLDRFNKEEQPQVEQMIERATATVRLIHESGFEKAAEFSNPKIT